MLKNSNKVKFMCLKNALELFCFQRTKIYFIECISAERFFLYPSIISHYVVIKISFSKNNKSLYYLHLIKIYYRSNNN